MEPRMETRKFKPEQKMDLIEESMKYRLFKYTPTIIMRVEDLASLMFKPDKDHEEGIYIKELKTPSGDVFESYAVVRYGYLGLIVVDILISVKDVKLWDLLSFQYSVIALGGLYEFVKNNLNNDLALDLAAEIIYG